MIDHFHFGHTDTRHGGEIYTCRVNHHGRVHAIEGTCPRHQFFTTTFLFCWGTKQSYLTGKFLCDGLQAEGGAECCGSDQVVAAGVERVTIHARKAWLTGLSPKENRSVPPLRYEDVHRLKRERPGLRVEINGGIASMEQVGAHLARVDGVMIGRAAIDNLVVVESASAVASWALTVSSRSTACRVVANGVPSGNSTEATTMVEAPFGKTLNLKIRKRVVDASLCNVQLHYLMNLKCM